MITQPPLIETEPKTNMPSGAPTNSAERTQIADLISSQYGGLLNLMRRKLKDRELAADLVNEAIAVTLEHADVGRLSRPDQIAGYVFKVSMNLLRNHQRNFDNRGDVRSSAEELDKVASQERDELESVQLKQKAHRLIASLASARDREVIKRFYLDEEEKQIICEELGLSPLQFTQVMSRARQRLKEIFESQGHKRTDFLSILF